MYSIQTQHEMQGRHAKVSLLNILWRSSVSQELPSRGFLSNINNVRRKRGKERNKRETGITFGGVDRRLIVKQVGKSSEDVLNS